MKILIAEDDLVSRSFLNKFLGKYGECDLIMDGLEALDAFLLALKEKEPYELICLDIMMPKADGIKTLKAIRDLERQYGVASQNSAKIIMTTALSEARLVQTAFDYGCEAYATKPIDTKKFEEVLRRLGLIAKEEESVTPPFEKDTGAVPDDGKNSPFDPGESSEGGYFKRVRALPNYRLEVVMETGTTIHFDFGSRLNTARFGRLSDEEFFRSVRSNGDYLVFERAGKIPLKITASEFMDLVLIDRRR